MNTQLEVVYPTPDRSSTKTDYVIAHIYYTPLERPARAKPGNTKGGSITVQLTSCLTGLDWSVLQIKTKIASSHTTDSKPVKQEVNGTVILPPLVFPG